MDLLTHNINDCLQASIDAARPPPSPKEPALNQEAAAVLPALAKMESTLLSCQRECLALLGEVKEASGRHEEYIKDSLRDDLR